MGKSGKLFSSLVNGVKALKSPSRREKSTTENSRARKDRDSLVTKHGCMWTLGKSSSRNKSSVGVSLHPDVEVKDVQVQQLSQVTQPPASSFRYTDVSLDEITSTLVDEIVQEEILPHESYQEDWATILKISDDESEPEQYLTHNAQPEEQAAVMIQAAIRRYLVQRNLKRRLEAVIRLQAVARGRIVRKQAATTLRCIHALVKFQANARGWLVRKSEVGQRTRQRLKEISLQDPLLLEEEFQDKKPPNHSQPIAFALDEQPCAKQSPPVMDFERDKEHWEWTWLERWMAARPWENSSPIVVKEKSRITVVDGEAELNNSVDEGAQIIVSNSEKQSEPASCLEVDSSIPSAGIKQSEPASCLKVDSSIPSAGMSALHEIPPPPPPPPLPLFIQPANHLIKHPRVTEESSKNAGLHIPAMIPFATKEFCEGASVCAPPTTLPELAIPNVTRECAPALNEGNMGFSTYVPSEVSLCTGAHAKEPEEIMLRGAPVDLGASQAESANPSIDANIANPSIDESSPPASSFLQHTGSSSSSSFTTKEEDWRQDSTPALLHLPASEGEDDNESAEPRVKTSALNDEPVRPTNEEETTLGFPSEVVKHEDTFEKSTSSTEDVSMFSDAEVQNIKAEAQETVEYTKSDLLQGSNGMRESYVQVKANGLHDTSVTPTTLSEASAKRIGSILVKHEQGEATSQSLPSYMATTKSSKAKVRSQASPKPMPESPKQRLVSPKLSSGSKRTATLEGRGSFGNSRQIVHVRAGSKGQLASTIKDGSTSGSFRLLEDSTRIAK